MLCNVICLFLSSQKPEEELQVFVTCIYEDMRLFNNWYPMSLVLKLEIICFMDLLLYALQLGENNNHKIIILFILIIM